MFEYIEDAKLKAQAVAEYESLTEGLVKKRDELLGVNKKLKDNQTIMTDKLQEFEGVDMEKHNAMLEKMKQDRLKELMGENKFEQVLKENADQIENKFKGLLKAAQETADSAKAESESIRLKNHQLRLSTLVATATTGIAKHNALKILTDMAGETFEADGDRFVSKLDGVIQANKEGKELTISDWVETVRGTHDFLFTKPKGGNTDLDRGEVTKNFNDLSESQQAEAIRENPSIGKSLKKIA
jgi:hypothetical protein